MDQWISINSPEGAVYMYKYGFIHKVHMFIGINLYIKYRKRQLYLLYRTVQPTYIQKRVEKQPVNEMLLLKPLASAARGVGVQWWP